MEETSRFNSHNLTRQVPDSGIKARMNKGKTLVTSSSAMGCNTVQHLFNLENYNIN